MHFSLLTTLALTATSCSAATIAELLRSRPDLSRVAAAIGNYPQWSNANAAVTLFAPTDSALASSGDLGNNTLGILYATQRYDWRDLPTNYFVLEDANGVRVVYDDYAFKQPTPEIHIRSGMADAIVSERIVADNGFLYIMPRAVPSPLNIVTTLNAQGLTSFVNLINDAGMANFFNSIVGATIFVPDNNIIAAAQAQWNGWSTSQKQAVLLYHIWPTRAYSTQLNAGQINSGLQGANHQLAISGESLTLDGRARVTLADIITSAGVIHRIDNVLIPNPLPSANAQVTPNGVSTTNAAGPTAAPSPSVVPSPRPSNSPAASPSVIEAGSKTTTTPKPLISSGASESFIPSLYSIGMGVLAAFAF